MLNRDRALVHITAIPESETGVEFSIRLIRLIAVVARLRLDIGHLEVVGRPPANEKIRVVRRFSVLAEIDPDLPEPIISTATLRRYRLVICFPWNLSC
jgi:hypothetical protein